MSKYPTTLDELMHEEDNTANKSSFEIFIGYFVGSVIFQLIETGIIYFFIQNPYPYVFPIAIELILIFYFSYFTIGSFYYNTKSRRTSKIEYLKYKIHYIHKLDSKEIINQVNNFNNNNVQLTKNVVLGIFEKYNNNFSFEIVFKKLKIDDSNNEIKDDVIKLLTLTKINYIDIFIQMLTRWITGMTIILTPFFTWGYIGWFSVIINICLTLILVYSMKILTMNKLR